MPTCCLLEAQERHARLMRTRSSGCSAQSATTQCASMKSMLYETGTTSHGPRLWQRQAPGSSVFHDRQSLQHGQCGTWALLTHRRYGLLVSLNPSDRLSSLIVARG